MFKNLRDTVKNVSIYAFGNLTLKLMGVVLLPLYTQHLTTEQYGIWSLLEVTSQLLISGFSFRLSTAVMRWYLSNDNKYNKGSIIFTGFLGILCIIILFNALFQPFTKYFSYIFFNNYEFTNYFLYIFIWCSLEIINRFFFDLIRTVEKSYLFILVTILKVLLIMGFNIYTIAYLGFGVEGIILGQITGSGLVVLFALPFIYKRISLNFNFSLFFEMLKYGMPLIFSGIANYLMSMGDRYILKYFLSLNEVGIYSLAYKIANLISIIVVNSFNMGFLPIAFKMFKENNAKRYFTKTLTYLVFITSILVLMLSAYAKEILVLLSKDKSYIIAYTVIPLIAFSMVFRAMSRVLLIGIHYNKKTKYQAYIMLIGIIFNFGINFILIPALGMYGAAITSIISNMLIAFLFYHYSQKFFFIKYEITKIIKMIGLMAIMLGAIYFINDLPFVFSLILKSFLIILFPLLLFLFRFYDKIEIDYFRKFLKRTGKTSK